MKYRIDFTNRHSEVIQGAKNTQHYLRSLEDGAAVTDVRIIYKSGASDSVMDIYKKYIPHKV